MFDKYPNRLRELRLLRGETQENLARVMGLKTAAAYSKKELGYNSTTIEQAQAIARHYGMSIEDIFLQEKCPKRTASLALPKLYSKKEDL